MPFTLDLQILLRLGLAVLCGLAVGINRAHHGNTSHPNRLRVHVLVGLSACLMVLAAGDDPQARSRVIQGVAPELASWGRARSWCPLLLTRGACLRCADSPVRLRSGLRLPLG